MVSSSLSQVLRSLTPVKRGDDVHVVASSERMNAIMAAIHLLTRGDNIVGGYNVRKTSGDGFVTLSADFRFSGPSGGGVGEVPFQVVTVPKSDSGFGTPIGVISNSHLFNTEDKDIYEMDNDSWGLLQDDIPTDDPHSWRNNYLGDKIFLEIELDPDQVILSVEIVHGAVGAGLWDNYPDPIEINTDDPDNPYQQFYHQIIAEVTDPYTDPRPGIQVKNDGDQLVQITQCLFCNLLMTTAHTTHDADQPDLELLVAIPWGMFPGTSTDGEANPINFDEDIGTPYQFGTVETANDYNFELFNASEEGSAKVLILDGVVYGPNNDSGVDPDGMPSNDTYVLSDINDGDEIWLGILWSPDDPPIIQQVWLDHGESTPDDEEETTYITIGNVEVDWSGDPPVVTCRNEVCGDVVVQLPPAPFSDNFVLMSQDGYLIWAEVCDATCGAD